MESGAKKYGEPISKRIKLYKVRRKQRGSERYFNVRCRGKWSLPTSCFSVQKMTSTLKQSIREVFEECQDSKFHHKSLVRKLVTLYKAAEFGKFWSAFVSLLKHALIVFEREPAVEKCLEFVAVFATSLKDDGSKKKPKDEKSSDDQESPEDEIDEDIHQFLLKLFDFCLQHHNANSHAVRFRVCQLINKLLNKMGEDAQIDDDLYDRIYECMLKRMRDLYPIVRIQAIFALARLQDPQDLDCPIINGYLFLLSCDPNSDVRRAVLTCIAASAKTLPAILERLRDVKDTVRRLAYQILAEKVHIRALNIAQRVSILENGLRDRVESVRNAFTSRLLQAWLRTFEGNILELLKYIDAENSLKTARQVISALLKKFPSNELVQNFDQLNENLVIESEKLTCESVLYWRALCEHLHEEGEASAEHLEKVLPLPLAFAAYISSLTAKMKSEEDLDTRLTNEFILEQLLEIAALLDLSDETGRRAVSQLIHDLLVSDLSTHTLVPTLVARHSQYTKDAVARINSLCEIIAEIREPITLIEDPRSIEDQRQMEIRVAQVKVKLNLLREELNSNVTNQNFARAAEIKAEVEKLEAEKEALLQESQPQTQEIRTEKTDPQTLLRCSAIASAMLTDLELRTMPVSLQTLMESLMLPAIQNEDPAVRNMAARALGRCCLMRKDVAKTHLVLFITMSQLDVETVRVTALKVIFDVLLVYGFDAFLDDDACIDDSIDSDKENEKPDEPDDAEEDEDVAMQSMVGKRKEKENEPKLSKNLLNILTELLNNKVSEIRTAAAEGLARLLFAGRIVSSKLISRLLLLWYNPVTEDDTLLRHCLGTFFPVYAFASVANQNLMEDAFLPTLRTIFNAPASSPLAEVDLNNVISLLVQLTTSRHLLQKDVIDMGTCCHDCIALKVSNEILNDTTSGYVRPLCGALNALELSNDKEALKEMDILADKMLENVEDKTCLRMLKRYKDKLQKTLQSNGHQSSTDKDSELPAESTRDETEELTTTMQALSTTETEAEQTVTETQVIEDEPMEIQPSVLREESSADSAPIIEETSSQPTPSNNRTALGLVQENHPKRSKVLRDSDREDTHSPIRKQPKTSTRSTRGTKESVIVKKRTEISKTIDNGSELENTVESTTPVRRSSRTTRSKVDAADSDGSEASSYSTRSTRSTRSRQATSKRK